MIDFFENNNFVNNSDKAAVLYNSEGKGKSITIEGIGGEKLLPLYLKNYLVFISIQALTGTVI